MNVPTLTVILYRGVQLIHTDNLVTSEVSFQQSSWVRSIFRDVVHVYAPRRVCYRIHYFVERGMQVRVAMVYVLVRSIQQILFDSAAVLIVKQAQVVGVLAHHRQRAERVREAVADRHALESGQEALVVLGLAQDFLADGGGVLAAIALAEDEEGTVASDAEFLEATVLTVVELFKSLIKIVGKFSHVGDISVGIGRICIAEPCANGLIYKEHVIVFGPCPLIPFDIPWLFIRLNNSKWPQFHQIAELAG